MAARTRLLKELKEFQKDASASADGLSLAPREDDVFRWTATLAGPADSPYEGGSFVVELLVPQQYPLVPPAARFKTRVFHPNVHFKTGEICLDILKTAWSPAWTLQSVCRAVIALLTSGESDSPLNCDAGNLLRAGDVRGFNSVARMYTEEYAKPPKT